MTDYEKLGVFYLGREVEAGGAAKDDLVLYDSRDLTTHAVCVGMTGSGKTGLCLALLEEAAIDGIPAICIDPKGDLGNLLLAFPQLAPADFQPWIDPADAARKGVTPEVLAAQTAESWRKGLAEWGQPAERIAKFRDAVDIAIYTPGAATGLPLSVLRSFAPPPPEALADAGSLRERVGTVVSGLFSLLGRDADPLQSREHILLANLIEHAWREGRSLDIAGLVAAVQRPPFDRVGAFDLETFYPAKERLQLAMALNNLLASPGFAAWFEGEALDAQRLLFTPEGRPRISIVSIAHLPDAERMFIVTLLLNEVIGWMRAQSGTSSLRAILYMDEIFGYFPPSANPPSKLPMLTLLKQARAFGLGCVLATQNPVDLDYKGLANAGTWFIGRLQTERDKLRVMEGLESAQAGAGLERAELDRLLSALAPRVFLMRNVHEDAPVLMRSRWALSYLRGPLTGAEISRLMTPRKAPRAAATAPTAGVTTATMGAPAGAAGVPRPVLPASIREYFLPSPSGREPLRYEARVMGRAKLHFVDAKLGLDCWQSGCWLAPLDDDGREVLWTEATTLPDTGSPLAASPQPDATFAPLPPAAQRAASYDAWGRTLNRHLYENARTELFVADALKAVSGPGESEGDFRARLSLQARERRDTDVEALRRRYAPRLASLQEQLRRAGERTEREKSQQNQQKLQTVLSVGATVLGALLGRRAISTSTLGRATTAARSAARIGREGEDVARAEESQGVLEQRLADLQRELETEIARAGSTFDAGTVALRRASVAPRKADIAVGELALIWLPRPQGGL
ncbi:MAG: ATP-binding protein [Gammaproteobacteria bacterium]|nr:ATP-binding protein [Gammaproteobacteria bacterium]